MLRKFAVAMLSVLLVVGAGQSAQARPLDEIIKSGTLRVGVLPNSPPQSALGASNELEGFDIDVAKKLAETLGVKPEF
uniref:transporter substrate-binding domain-containing protein n=1 Tax=Pseudomonas sp. TaxID=306 RepID=UPI0026219EA3